MLRCAVMRRLSLLAWACALLAVPDLSNAQTLPMPTLPTPPPVADPGDAAPTSGTGLDALGSAGGARPRPWDYGLGVGIGYDSNIDFRVPDGPSSWGVTPRGNLARTFWSPRGELRLGGTGSWSAYSDASDLNRYDVTLSIDAAHRSSPSTSWRAAGSYGFGYGDSSTVLIEQGVLLPRVKTQTLTASAGVSRQLGTRSSLRIDARAYRTDFDDQDPLALGLVDGQSFRGTIGLERKLGPRDTTAIEYSLESVLGRFAVTGDGERDSYLTHFASLQWTHILSARSGLLLEAGGSYTPDVEASGLGQRGSFFGGATYSRRLGRSTASLFARREVLPAFGLGVSRVENRFGANVATPLGRAWRLAFNGSYTLPETPEDDVFSYGESTDVSGVLARRVARRFEVSAEGRYRWRGATAFPEIDSYQLGLFVSLVRP